jgi:hypothetical protein
MGKLEDTIKFFEVYPLFIKILIPLLVALVVILLIIYSPKSKLNDITDTFFKNIYENIKKSRNELELINALEQLFLLPEYDENYKINWEEFSYIVVSTRLIVLEIIPKFKRNTYIKNAFIIVNRFLINLEKNAEEVFGSEFSLQNHTNKYISSRNEFIDNLPARESGIMYNNKEQLTKSDYYAEKSKKVLKNLRLVLNNIFKWKNGIKPLEITKNDFSAPPHTKSFYETAANSSNFKEYELVLLYSLRWIGDGAIIIEEGKEEFPASIILKDKKSITSTFGHDCIINFDLEINENFKWVKVEKIFIKVKDFRRLKNYELLLPLPFEKSNVYYILLDDPKISGKSEFEAELIYYLNGKVNKFDSIRLFPNKPESFAIRIDAKSEGLYTFDLYCILNSNVKKEIICIFRDAIYAFVDRHK